MPLARSAPLARAVESAFPSRPFGIEFWDGTQLPPSDGGPTFTVRSPKAVAHALRAPGQLGLGRAYASGELELDDLDAVMRVVGEWRPPQLNRRERARLALAA